jgi:hypothetical protein
MHKYTSMYIGAPGRESAHCRRGPRASHALPTLVISCGFVEAPAASLASVPAISMLDFRAVVMGSGPDMATSFTRGKAGAREKRS